MPAYNRGTPEFGPDGAPGYIARPAPQVRSRWDASSKSASTRCSRAGTAWRSSSRASARTSRSPSKNGGADPHSNPALRRCIQNARAVNMPKDKVEAAIKRASGRDATNYDEVIYEGYAPHGVAVLVEARDRQPDAHRRRTCATSSASNGGNLGDAPAASASMFKRMGVFRLNAGGHRPGRARALPDRPRPRGDGREHRREGRAADRRALRVRRTSARCRRRSRTAASRRCRREHEYICQHRRPSCPRTRPPRCSS